MTDFASGIARLDAAGITGWQDDLAGLLIVCVAHGGSLGYRAPLAPERARAVFAALAEAERAGQALVFTAIIDGRIAGCIAVLAERRETEPHVAEIGKLMVHPEFRRLGIGAALIAAAERAAFAWSRPRLYLFAADDGTAPAFYDRVGYVRAGRIPEAAALPDGSLADALIFTRRLSGDSA
ncbi:MAG TPA: GNAT family N-acetyltransferase [Acidiphilium sp.]